MRLHCGPFQPVGLTSYALAEKFADAHAIDIRESIAIAGVDH